MFSPGMYSELNNVYNDMCPTPQMDIGREDNLYQHTAQAYPQQYNSPVNTGQNQQLPIVPYGVHSAGQHRSFSPGMSGSSSDLRGMGIPSHVSPDSDAHYSASPRDLTTVASRPDLQWMVTTSNIDMRTVTPPNAIVSHAGHSSGLQYGSTMASNQGENSAAATITHHSGYGHMERSGPGSSASLSSQRPIARTKSGKPKGTPGRKRKVDDHELTPEEAAKRHLRRERNKLAAAKCRNRRRELTDRLQGETDILEDHQGMLTQEIVSLQQEKDHLEFILATHTPICKVLQNKQMNIGENQSPREMQSLHSCSENMGMGDHSANLVAPMDIGADFDHLPSSNSAGRSARHNAPEQATTVSVIQAGPSLTGSMSRGGVDENDYRTQNSSVIVGTENLALSGQAYPSMQPEDLSTSAHGSEMAGRRYPAPLGNLDVLDQVVSGEPLNTPVCTLATPSNTTAVFTFPNTPCMTSQSLVSGGINFSDFNSTSSMDYNGSNSGSVMSTGNFLHPSHIQNPIYNTNSSQSVITSGGMYSSARESCAAAHRRSSSSESHHSPDSVQSPKLLSL